MAPPLQFCCAPCNGATPELLRRLGATFRAALQYYYLVKLRTQKNAINYRNEQLPIIPGMVASVDIISGKKSILDYLLKPILKARQNALRER